MRYPVFCTWYSFRKGDLSPAYSHNRQSQCRVSWIAVRGFVFPVCFTTTTTTTITTATTNILKVHGESAPTQDALQRCSRRTCRPECRDVSSTPRDTCPPKDRLHASSPGCAAYKVVPLGIRMPLLLCPPGIKQSSGGRYMMK